MRAMKQCARGGFIREFAKHKAGPAFSALSAWKRPLLDAFHSLTNILRHPRVCHYDVTNKKHIIGLDFVRHLPLDMQI